MSSTYTPKNPSPVHWAIPTTPRERTTRSISTTGISSPNESRQPSKLESANGRRLPPHGPRDRTALHPGPLPPPLDLRLRGIQRGHDRATSGGGKRCVPVPGCHIEHTASRAYASSPDERLRSRLEDARPEGVVSGREEIRRFGFGLVSMHPVSPQTHPERRQLGFATGTTSQDGEVQPCFGTAPRDARGSPPRGAAWTIRLRAVPSWTPCDVEHGTGGRAALPPGTGVRQSSAADGSERHGTWWGLTRSRGPSTASTVDRRASRRPCTRSPPPPRSSTRSAQAHRASGRGAPSPPGASKGAVRAIRAP